MLSLKQVFVSSSTYTADVSGVCSALFELGGMTVIHDPSGCNSTYNTHDEPRWYGQDSLVFISGLSQMDALMGNDEKLIRDIERAAIDLKPSFISLVRTPVPLMTGMDFEAIAGEIEARTGIKTLYFPTTGMLSYVRGAGMALEAVARHLIEPRDSCRDAGKKSAGGRRPGVNVLGVTPLDFSVGTTVDSIRTWLEDQGFHVQSVFAMGSSIDEIRTAGQADLNLVVSSVGFPAARELERRFGTPYVIGCPVADYGEILKMSMLNTIHGREQGRDWRSINLSACDMIKQRNKHQNHDAYREMFREPCYLIGEPVTGLSIAGAIYLRTGVLPVVLSPLETDQEIISVYCRPLRGEEEIRRSVKDAKTLIADPMYREICPEGAEFISLPHEAYSGRIYRSRIPDLVRIFETWPERIGR